MSPGILDIPDAMRLITDSREFLCDRWLTKTISRPTFSEP
jgi:hypothetical protein